MQLQKPLLILLSLALVFAFSCTKDYSYEGGVNYVPRRDTLPSPPNPPAPYVCPSCVGNDDFIEDKWSLHVGPDFYCGIIDTIITTPTRTGFTFFGPSACSLDSGMVITVNLDGESFTHDINNYTTTKAGFYYYDKVTPSYMLITNPGDPFSLHVISYNHQTKMFIGSFSGFAKLANGGSAFVSNAKFKLKVP